MINLFQSVDFVSHSGLNLTWKIECDAISDEEWKTLAKMIREYETSDWKTVVGIPRGGMKLANALDIYSTNNSKDPILIADDVYTTGRSFRDFSNNFPNDKLLKWCIFARNPIKGDEKTLFTMPTKENI
tara:strand:+ start:837 stop:1223 length:387 start_codon:yes stop_codon:yes gene_type:complete